jgi:uncharacterized repeat protein (TIGR02543 family)
MTTAIGRARNRISRAVGSLSVLALIGSGLTVAPIETASASGSVPPGCEQILGTPANVSIQLVGNDCVITFSGSSTWTLPDYLNSVRLLVIGGGGGGGAGIGGGGGAGEMVEASSFPVVGGSSVLVSVGAGGAGGNASTQTGNPGQSSSFGDLVAHGGGGGGFNSSDPVSAVGPDLGSGGGAGFAGSLKPVATRTSISGVTFSKNVGGGPSGGGCSNATAGGGGGAGGAGIAGQSSGVSDNSACTPGDPNSDDENDRGGNGGDGKPNDITGANITYAGGGGGGINGSTASNDCCSSDGPTGQGGSGGGGDAGLKADVINSAGGNGFPAQVNTGSGGGGASNGSLGGDGASGVVIVRFTIPQHTLTLDSKGGTGGTASSPVLTGATPTITAPTKVDYALMGWSTDDNDSAEYLANLSDFTMPNEDETLYAVWVPLVSFATEDTYVRWTTDKSRSFWDENEILLKNAGLNSSTNRVGYVKFAFNPNVTWQGAAIEFTVKLNSDAGTEPWYNGANQFVVEVYGYEDSDWNEQELTFDTASAATEDWGLVSTSFPASPRGGGSALGTISILTHPSTMGERFSFSSSSLDALLNADQDGEITLFLKRQDIYAKPNLGFATNENLELLAPALVATGENQTFQVSYDANGGSGIVKQGQYVIGGSPYQIASASNLTAPTGKVFSRWATHDGGGGTSYSAGASYSTTQDLPLYAIWVDEPTITTPSSGLDATVGESFSLAVSTSGGTGSNTFSVVGTLPAGLTINSSTGEISGSPTTAGSQSIQVTVEDSNGNTATTNSFTISVAGAPLSNIATPSASTTSQARKSIDVSWSAVANASSYTVRVFNAAGDTELQAISIVSSATSITVNSTNFAGIQDDTTYKVSIQAVGTGNYVSSNESAQVSVDTLATHVLTFNANYGSGGPSTATQTLGTNVATNLDANPFSRSGFAFLGWATNADGTGTRYSNGQSITLDDNETLYARWGSLTPKIYFNSTDLNSYNQATNTFDDLGSLNLSATANSAPTLSEAERAWVFAGGPHASANFIGLGNIATSNFSQGITIDFEADFGTKDIWERIIDFSESGQQNDNLFIGRHYNTDNLRVDLFNGSSSVGQCDTSGNEIGANSGFARWTIVLDGVNCQIFREGTLVKSQSYPYLPSQNITWIDNFIGKSNWSDDPNFEGKIRSLRVFDSGITPSQMGAINYRTVNFDAGNGSVAVSSMITSGAIPIDNDASGNAGYSFGGWSTTQGGSDIGGSFTPSVSPQTLYAIWQSNLGITTPSSGLSATVGSSYSLSISSSGGSGTKSYTATGLQNGLSIDSGTGTISGTPTQAGTQTITVTVTDGNGNTASTSSFTITISSMTLFAAAPTGAATANTLKSFDVSWSAVANADDYTLKIYAADGTTLLETITGLSGTSKTITVNELSSIANGTTYQVSLIATGSGNYTTSLESTKTSVTTITPYIYTYKSHFDGGPADQTQAMVPGLATKLRLNVFERPGYVLAGWSRFTDCGNFCEIDPGFEIGKSVTASSDLTLYAIWAPRTEPVIDYNASSFSGSTLRDNAGNTDATLYNVNVVNANGSEPTYANVTSGASNNIYTNTGLTRNEFPNDSVSIFATVYPTSSNHVVVEERGSARSSSPDWFNTQIEMVNGVYQFRVYGCTPIVANQSTALNEWHTVGFTYSHSMRLMIAYINGEQVGSRSNCDRVSPMFSLKPLYYGIGSNAGTDLNSQAQSYGGFRLSSFQVYNTVPSVYLPNVLSETVQLDYRGNFAGAVNTTHFASTGESVTVAANTFTRSGFAFNGWNTAADGTGTAYAAGDTIILSSSATLHAQWLATTANVSYEENGGSTVPDGTFVFGEVLTLPANPTRAGYTFDGWSETDGGTAVPVPYPPAGSSDITLYARWTPNTNTVTWDTNGGSSIANSTFLTGGTLSLPASPSLSGKVFQGWSTSETADQGEIVNKISSWPYSPPDTSDITLYAIWTSVCTPTVTSEVVGGVTYSVVKFTSTGSCVFVAPDGVSAADVLVVGAGGGGASGRAGGGSMFGGGGGGGGGAWVKSENLSLTAGNEYLISVGAGGAKGASGAANNGADGESSNFAGVVDANGGQGGRHSLGTTQGGLGGAGGSGSGMNSGSVGGRGSIGMALNTSQRPTNGGAGTTVSLGQTTFCVGGGGGGGNRGADTNFFNFQAKGGVCANPSALSGGNGNYYAHGAGNQYVNPSAGVANTGGGGGGGSYTSGTFRAGADGGSGLVALRFAADLITVTYEVNGGVALDADTLPYGTTSVTLPTPTRTGYTFAGWYSEAGLITSVSSPYSPDQDTTIYAKWTPNINTVTFKANYAGGPSDETQTITTDFATDLRANDFTRTGYTFSGWNTSDLGTETGYDDEESVTLTGPLTLFAQWTVVSFTVTYDKNGATGNPERGSDSWSYGSSGLTLPLVGSMTKSGYTFNGWSTTQDDVSTKVSSPYTPGASVTLYALWSAATYSITYNDNGATSGAPSLTSDSYTTGGSPITLATQNTMQRDGYNFLGWSTTVNNPATQILNSGSYTITAPVILFALWDAIDYSVTYNSQGSDGGSVPTDGTDYNIGDLVAVKANTGSLTKAGYDFVGWTDNSSGTGTVYQSGDTYTVGTSNITFYPKWEAATFIISLNTNGATGLPAGNVTSVPYTYNPSADASLPNVGNMQLVGHDFAGWSLTPTGSVITSGFKPTSNVTVYAIWTLKNIAVNYARGSVPGQSDLTNFLTQFPGSTTKQFGSTHTLPIAAATPTSGQINLNITVNSNIYKFFGWTDGSTTYAPGASYLITETAPTFTARWERLYAVRYALNGGGGIVAIDTECLETDNTCTNNQVINLSAAPTRDGYTFAGWKDEVGNDYAAGAAFTVTDSTFLLFAQWTPIDYEITFDVNGGSGNPTDLTKTIGQSFNMPAAGTKTGYDFAGWSDGTVTLGVGTSFTVGTSNKTFTAQWTPKVYTVSYNWNGGTGPSTQNRSFTFGTAAFALPSGAGHSKDGYEFAGWSLTDGGALVDDPFTPASSVMLFAKWVPGEFTLTFNTRGGTMDDLVRQVANDGSSINLPTPTRAGFKFDGWFEDAATTRKLGNGNASYTPNATRTLQAKWVQNSLWGINPAHLNVLTTINVTGSHTWSGSHSLSGTGAALSIPDGALPNGTQVKVQFVDDLTRPAGLINANYAYYTSVVLSWLTGSGDSATVPDTAAGKPIQLVLTNPNIRVGSKVFMILGGEVTEVATATQNGTVTIEVTTDPEFVIAATTPTAPTGVTATAGDTQVTVSWTASSSGGSDITGYTVTANPGGATCQTVTTSCVVTGLTNGTAYTFTVTATNSVGTSTASAASSPVTPSPTQYVLTFNSNGGSNVASANFIAGGTVQEPTDPTRSGYTFAGWTTTVDDEATLVTFPYDPGVTANVTLYALWTQVVAGPTDVGSSSTPSTPRPSVSGVTGSNQIAINENVRLEGAGFNTVKSVLVDGFEASFFANSSTLITIRIPIGVEPGDVRVTLIGDFGQISYNNLFEVVALEIEQDTKVTVGTFLGYAAVYTKNFEGQRLSMKVGDKWRVVPRLGADYTRNLTKVGVGKTTTVMVYINRKLVRVEQLTIR